MASVVIIGPAHPLRGGLASFDERLAREFQSQVALQSCASGPLSTHRPLDYKVLMHQCIPRLKVLQTTGLSSTRTEHIFLHLTVRRARTPGLGECALGWLSHLLHLAVRARNQSYLMPKSRARPG